MPKTADHGQLDLSQHSAVDQRADCTMLLSAEQAQGQACSVCGQVEPPEGQKVPVHTADGAAWACADCAETAATRTGRPWWQNRPCDAWCQGSHPMHLEGPDRVCLSDWEANIPLSLFQQHRDGDGNVYPQFAQVYLEREQREIEPRVVLLTPGRMPSGLSLTLVEGAQLAAALAAAAQLAGGAQ